MRGLLGALLVAGTITTFSSTASSDDKSKDAAMVSLTPADVKWGDAPPVLPKGAKFSLLYGDPSKAGALYIVRLKAPANYKIPAHWHPADENVTVIEGTFYIGMGDKLDTKGKAMPAGSFFSMPAQMHHYAYTKDPVTLEIAGVGPFAMTYINPADDPTAAAATKK